ncbi:hypothetical protein CAL26_09285 [Bordetella genomosp. 9]|uniref:Uncharacterized protein n=1 Tax=Bordetella genomosp. 9 TaxID=1416803 RepID=A0A261RF25_9BORD|nr:hypothetical protein [Bordetella genomosp. 9]OZI23624.1 hypothetical protein CAL26_09285 [Bordetella genomosp. 9]
MPITPLPDPPSRSDPANFPERADAFMAALPLFAQQANTLQQQVNQKEQDVANSATAAATSAEQAAGSASSASQSATGAAQARTDAQTAAGAAAGSAAQAQEYFEQMQVEGGLPVFAAANLPTSNIGSIYVSDAGPMEWDTAAARYLPVFRFAECRLVLGAAPKSVKLVRYGGSRITVNGKGYVIPAAGIEAQFSQAAAGLIYFVYLRVTNGVLNLLALQTAHVTNADGSEVASGNPDFLLVGMFRVNGADQLLDSTTERGVASWFNRRKQIVTSTISNASTASLTGVSATARNVLAWKGESVDVSLWGNGTNTQALMPSYAVITDQGAAQTIESTAQPSVANQFQAFAQSFAIPANQDGFFQPGASIRVGGGTGTFQLHLRAEVLI